MYIILNLRPQTVIVVYPLDFAPPYKNKTLLKRKGLSTFLLRTPLILGFLLVMYARDYTVLE